MKHKFWSRILVGCFALSLTGLVAAAEVQGTITKVDEGGKAITVKGKDGKEVNVKVSGSRTELVGVTDRGDLKAGQNVSVTYDGDQAKKVVKK